MTGAEYPTQPNLSLEKYEIECLFEHNIKTTENMKECSIKNIGEYIVFANSPFMKKLEVRRENFAERKPKVS